MSAGTASHARPPPKVKALCAGALPYIAPAAAAQERPERVRACGVCGDRVVLETAFGNANLCWECKLGWGGCGGGKFGDGHKPRGIERGGRSVKLPNDPGADLDEAARTLEETTNGLNDLHRHRYMLPLAHMNALQ